MKPVLMTVAMSSSLLTNMGYAELRMQQVTSMTVLQESAATDVTPSSVTPLDAVVVTATRTPQTVLSALTSLDVLGQDDLRSRQVVSLEDGLRTLPNVNGQVGPRRSVQQLNVRGLDDRRVGLKVDGRPQNFRGEYKGRFFIDPSVLKQVDVVRGSNSVLDGSGALAGTVGLTTKDASDYLAPGETYGATVGLNGATQGGSVGGNVAVYGRQGAYDLLAFQALSAAGNLRLGDDKELPYSELNTKQSLLKGTVQATDATALTASFLDYYDRGDSTSNPVRKAPFAGFVTDRRAHQQTGTLQLRHTPAANPLLDVTALAYAGKTKLTEVVIQNGPSKGRRDETTYGSAGGELTNTSRFSALAFDHAVTAGVSYANEEQRGSRPGALRSELYPRANSTNAALFVQNEMQHGKWRVTPGARLEGYELKGDTLNQKNSDEKLLGKLAAGYQFTQAWLGYASVAQGYRAPLLSEAFASGTLGGPLRLVPNPTLKPEESVTYETGAKGLLQPGWLANDSLQVRGAVFVTDLENLIERQSLSATQFAYRNVAKAQTKGVEVSLDYASASWFGSLGAGYTHGENKTQSQPLLDIPPLKANLTAGYQLDTGHGPVRLGGTLEAASRQTRVPANDLLVGPSKGYGVVGAFAEWTPRQTLFKDMKVNLVVDNLLDKRYRRVTSFIDETGVDARAGVTIKF